MQKEILTIKPEDIEKKTEISEEIAHQIIAGAGKVLMIIERNDGTFYGYEATQFTDLGHGKKLTVNELVGFYKI